MNQKISNENLLVGLKKQLQKVLFNQQQLLLNLEQNDLVPQHDTEKPLVFDNKTVPEMKNVLQGEYTKLENFEVVLAVVGTMKAGKSTTINAIVGREILPNRNRAMTSLPTLIAHKKDQKEPILTCDVNHINKYISQLKKIGLSKFQVDDRVKTYKEMIDLIKNIQGGYKFKKQYKGEEAIFSFLAHLNDLVRLSRVIGEEYPNLGFPFAAYKEVNSLPRIDIEFTELAKQDDQLGNLVLLDTPGPNEANIPELRNIFEQQLKRSSAVMVILDYAQLNSQADADIRDELEKLPKVDKDRLFALVNQFDRKDTHGDSEASTKEIVLNDLLKDQVKLENIYCISALNAFLANTVLTIIEKEKSKPQFSNTRVEDFAKKAFGESDAQEDWEDASLEKIQKRAIKMIENSHIKMPLQNIIHESYKNAPKIAMSSALRDVNYIFTEIKNVFSIQGRFTEAVQLNERELASIKNTIKQLEQDIVELKKNTKESKNQLESTANQTIDEFSKSFNLIEESILDRLWLNMMSIIKDFKTEKNNELKDTKKLITMKWNYRADRDRLKKQVEVLEETIADKNNPKGIIKLHKDQMTELNKKMIESLSNMNRDIESEIKNTLNGLSLEINSDIKKINNNILKDMERISNSFNKEKIEINLSYLNMNEIEIQSSIEVKLLNISSKTEIKEWVTTNKITSFLGNLIGQRWGQTLQVDEYFEFTLPQLKKYLQDLSLRTVLTPLQKRVSDDLKDFIGKMEEDTKKIALQAEKLINELKSALEAEKLPHDVLQKRKESLKQIAFENTNIQRDIFVVEKNLSKSLGKVA